MAYAVMEYIELIGTPVLDFPQKVALALQWPHDPPAPSDHVRIGPLADGRARHLLFKNCKAPPSFTSIYSMERYSNEVCLFTCS